MFYPLQVVEAMRTSISNMVGVLPPHYFDVTVSTMGENLAQLMFSVIMTGAHTGWPTAAFMSPTGVQRCFGTRQEPELIILVGLQGICLGTRSTAWSCSAAWTTAKPHSCQPASYRSQLWR